MGERDDSQRRSNFYAICTLIIAFVGMTCAVISTCAQLRSVQRDVSAVDAHIATLGAAPQFVIVSPKDGADVTMNEPVLVATPYRNMMHYVVVTPIVGGGDYIQNGGTLNNAPIWSGTAQFGVPNAGSGERFLVRVLVTNIHFDPGPLPAIPKDSVLSAPITVRRVQ